MTAMQLILFNAIIIGGVGILVYLMTHNRKKKHNQH
jgi:hypothetical protein